MNFCVAVLIWSAVIIYTYAFSACMIDIDMLVLGLSPAKTSQQLCEVVHWGHDAQMRLIWAKTSFVAFAYFFTFIGCICFGIYQHKEFHRLDDTTTMGDFAAFVTGLPALKGSDRAEDELAQFIEQGTGQKVRGVTICWNYIADKDIVEKAIEADWQERELEQNPPVPEDPMNPRPRQPRLGWIRRQFRKLDCLLGFEKHKQPEQIEGIPVREGEAPADALLPAAAEPKGPTEAEITSMLGAMESSDCAFIIFDSEEVRNDAIAKAEEKLQAQAQLEYKGSKITMIKKVCEPESVRFYGLGLGSFSATRVQKMSQGCLITLGALLLWCGLFYLPYAYFMCSFSYAHGEVPGALAENVFTVLVVAGNQGMYFLADVVADRANFGFADEREIAYNYVYVSAVVLNAILDVGIILFLSYRIMIGIGAHTADDRLLASLNDFRDIFESYPIQKVFGELLYEYSFPACFLCPFVLEGLFTICVPYNIMKHIVLSHDEVQGRVAEQSMVYFLPMNLGRYGDIILNMILCALVFFCPGGFTLPLFLAFFFCHCCIYMYDQWRVLRATPTFHYASTEVDRFGQLQLIIPTVTLGGCLFFRCSQMYPSEVLSGWLLYGLGFAAAAIHCGVHYACVKFLVPMFSPDPHEPSTKTYGEIAATHCMTWFSANPVHCLRSKYIYKDNPPHIHCINGKEHLQKSNEKIGAYFQELGYGASYKVTKAVQEEETQAKIEDEDEKRAIQEDEEEPDY